MSSATSPDTYEQACQIWREAERRAADSQRETQRLQYLAHQAFMQMMAMIRKTSGQLRWTPTQVSEG